MTDQPQTLFRLRVGYVKHGRLRHLGHLEVLRTVERSVRRAGLPYAVTQGFSPHMRIAFASALPTGTASDGEFYDLYLTEYVPAPEAYRRLRAATPEGLAPFACAYVDLRAPALTAALTRARYRIELAARQEVSLPSEDVLATALAETAALPVIEYLRGKKVKRMDVARTLVSARVERADGQGAALELDTRSSNDGALRPEVLVREFERRLSERCGRGGEALFEAAVTTRLSQHEEAEDGVLVPPLPEHAERRASKAATSEV